MSDIEQPTQEDGQEVVTDTQEGEGQENIRTAEDEGKSAEAEQATKDAQEAEEETKRKESAKERRERDKAYKQRLREEASAAEKRAQEADDRLKSLLDAGNRQQAPRRDQFADGAEYAAAKAVWDYHQATTKDQIGQAERTAEQERQALDQIHAAEQQLVQQNWSEQLAEGRAKYPDFEQVAYTSPISNEVADAVAASDIGAELAYYFGKNPDVARQISLFSKTDRAEASRQFGFIEAQVRQSLTAAAPRTASAAPPPTTPVKGATTGTKSPDKMTPNEYRAWREAGGKF